MFNKEFYPYYYGLRTTPTTGAARSGKERQMTVKRFRILADNRDFFDRG
jgi:hypothetical protein